jgi:uncharacterized hydrophobic protein (TIGR00271 family)
MENRAKASADTTNTIYRHERLHLVAGDRLKLYQSVLDSSTMDPEYLTMLGLSGLIALFGLMQNSVAVIIGAMLISPLMNPVLAGALALLLGDGKLGRKSALVLGISVAGVIALTAVVTWLSPLKEITPEILARTNPNLLDLFIAFLSGLAGTLAMRSGATTLTIIPGVAIAVAVVPPLSVVGYSMSTHHYAMAWGGFLLFITNLVSIMISAAMVFGLMGFAPHERTDGGKAKLRVRMAVSALILGILAVPLIQTLRRAVTQIGLRADVENVIQQGFKTDHSTITDFSYSEVDNHFRVQVTLRTTQYFESPQIRAVQDALQNRFGPQAELMVDQILVAQGGLSPEQMARIKDFISGTVVQAPPKEEPFDLKAAAEKTASYLQKQVDDVIHGTPIQGKGPVLAEIGGGSPVKLNLRLAVPEPLDQQTVKLLASQLSIKVNLPVQVHGVAELAGSNYSLALESPDTKSLLKREDRLKLADLVALLVKRPDLQLRAAVSAKNIDADILKSSSLWREVNTTLSRSQLEASQWSMQVAPDSGTPQTAPPPASPAAGPPAALKDTGPTTPPRGPIRCNFRVVQNF